MRNRANNVTRMTLACRDLRAVPMVGYLLKVGSGVPKANSQKKGQNFQNLPSYPNLYPILLRTKSDLRGVVTNAGTRNKISEKLRNAVLETEDSSEQLQLNSNGAVVL